MRSSCSRRPARASLRLSDVPENYIGEDVAARYAAYSAGQAACVSHVAEHDLGAAAYAIRAIRAANPRNPDAGRVERDWQRDRLDEQIRALVLEDQARRNPICWSAFAD